MFVPSLLAESRRWAWWAGLLTTPPAPPPHRGPLAAPRVVAPRSGGWRLGHGIAHTQFLFGKVFYSRGHFLSFPGPTTPAPRTRAPALLPHTTMCRPRGQGPLREALCTVA